MLIMLTLQFLYGIQQCVLCNIFCLLPPVSGVARQQTSVWKISQHFQIQCLAELEIASWIKSDHLSNAFSFRTAVSVVSSPDCDIPRVHRIGGLWCTNHLVMVNLVYLNH